MELPQPFIPRIQKRIKLLVLRLYERVIKVVIVLMFVMVLLRIVFNPFLDQVFHGVFEQEGNVDEVLLEFCPEGAWAFLLEISEGIDVWF